MIMRKTKAETEDTIQNLIEIGRNHFTEKGYTNSSLEEIVSEAGLTRGAIYHHFGNKKGLFRVVLESIQKEIAAKVEIEAAKGEDVWEQLFLGCQAFVTAAVERQNKRILLIEGPAVIGWERWRILDQQNAMRLLYEQLLLMQEQGH